MTALPRPNPTVVFCEVEDGAVLLAAEAEVYYGLNRVGARVWSLLPPAHADLESLCQVLASEYPEVDPATIREDATTLLNDLLQNGLVQGAD